MQKTSKDKLLTVFIILFSVIKNKDSPYPFNKSSQFPFIQKSLNWKKTITISPNIL
jgi:hypothetical protein